MFLVLRYFEVYILRYVAANCNTTHDCVACRSVDNIYRKVRSTLTQDQIATTRLPAASRNDLDFCIDGINIIGTNIILKEILFIEILYHTIKSINTAVAYVPVFLRIEIWCSPTISKRAIYSYDDNRNFPGNRHNESNRLQQQRQQRKTTHNISLPRTEYINSTIMLLIILLLYVYSIFNNTISQFFFFSPIIAQTTVHVLFARIVERKKKTKNKKTKQIRRQVQQRYCTTHTRMIVSLYAQELQSPSTTRKYVAERASILREAASPPLHVTPRPIVGHSLYRHVPRHECIGLLLYLPLINAYGAHKASPKTRSHTKNTHRAQQSGQKQKAKTPSGGHGITPAE